MKCAKPADPLKTEQPVQGIVTPFPTAKHAPRRTANAGGEVVGVEEYEMRKACAHSAFVPPGEYLLDGLHLLIAEAPVERRGHGARLVRIAYAHDGARQHRRA